MQRLLKFTTSPNSHRAARLGQNGKERASKSVDLEDDQCDDPSSTDLNTKLNALSFCVPEQTLAKSPQELVMSTLSPPSPHPSVASGSSGGDSSLLSPAPPVSPALTDNSLSPGANSSPSLTPTKSKKAAFFSSSRFSLDEHSPTFRFGFRSSTSPSHDKTPPAPSPNDSPQKTQPHRRVAVHLPSSPIGLSSPKSSGAGLCSALGSQTSFRNATDFGDLEHMNSSNEGYQLTAEQRDLVRQAWRNCATKRGGSSAGAWIFKRIFAHYPYLKRLFNLHEIEDDRLLDSDPKFQKHAQLFTDVLEMVIDSIDSLDDTMGPLLLSYGSKHVRFETDHGFRPEYWDAFAVVMTEYATNNWKSLKNHHRKAEALKAWRILIFFIVSKVRQGYTLEKMASESRRTEART